MTIAVLVIMITAPIGCALIAILGPRLLKKTPKRIDDNPTTVGDVIIAEERNDYNKSGTSEENKAIIESPSRKNRNDEEWTEI